MCDHVVIVFAITKCNTSGTVFLLVLARHREINNTAFIAVTSIKLAAPYTSHHSLPAEKWQRIGKQASIFICHSVKTHNNAKIYIKQADRLPERPKAINAGCPKLTDNTMNAMKKKERKKKRKKRKKKKKKYIQMRDTRKAIRYTKFSVQ